MKKIWLLAAAVLALNSSAGDYKSEASVSVSGTTARNSSALGVGVKVVHCTVAAFYVQGDSAVTATTGDIPLAANEKWSISVDQTSRYVAFITSGGTGTCYIHPSN